jgi:hypothetical protein
MTGPRRPRRGSRGRNQSRNKVKGLWHAVPRPDPVEPIRPAPVPTALLESLGSPPLRGHASAADHYLAAVVERAAAVATALAASAGVLATSDDDP